MCCSPPAITILRLQLPPVHALLNLYFNLHFKFDLVVLIVPVALLVPVLLLSVLLALPVPIDLCLCLSLCIKVHHIFVSWQLQLQPPVQLTHRSREMDAILMTTIRTIIIRTIIIIIIRTSNNSNH
jgi:hypothetical protein